MVTPMTEQSGPSDPSQRPSADRPASDRPRQSSPPPRLDLVGDLNRWLIRQGAKNVRKEIGGQVRRTLGGGGRSSSTSDVWDTATSEIPPEVGESPECQWCPICRAARRMRESGPGIGGQLSGAGEAVAAAVQDAFGALDLAFACRAHQLLMGIDNLAHARSPDRVSVPNQAATRVDRQAERYSLHTQPRADGRQRGGARFK